MGVRRKLQKKHTKKAHKKSTQKTPKIEKWGCAGNDKKQPQKNKQKNVPKSKNGGAQEITKNKAHKK